MISSCVSDRIYDRVYSEGSLSLCLVISAPCLYIPYNNNNKYNSKLFFFGLKFDRDLFHKQSGRTLKVPQKET
jgi:hypothetical protein